MPRIELYHFRYRSTVTGKMVKARYVAELREIAARHAEWEIVGPPEIRDVQPGSTSFNPYRVVPHAELVRLQEPAPQLNPHLEQPPKIDAVERLLVALFLRRYIAYCAKRRQFASMESAASLWREVQPR